MEEIKVNEATTPNEAEVDSTAVEVEAPTETPTEENSTEAAIDTDVILRYNKADVKVSREEAVRLAQYGMHLEKIGAGNGNEFKELMSDLDYYATLQGKSMREMVKDLVNGIENSYKEELIDQLGEGNPLIEEMLDLQRQKNRKVYEDAKTAREKKAETDALEKEKSTAALIAQQFENVTKDFPDYKTIEDIPESVLKSAFRSGDLEKELLKYTLTEIKKVDAAKKQQEKNKNENIGSAHSDAANNDVMSAILKGLRG